MFSFGNNIVDSPKEQSVESIFTPFQLVSLLEMLRFYADKFVNLMVIVERIRTVSEHFPDEIFKPQDEDPLLIEFGDLRTSCQELQLDLSVMQIERTMVEMSSQEIPSTDFKSLLGNLIQIITDELSRAFLMSIPQRIAVDYYEKSNLFGDKVFNNFPSANFDIEEAGKCFATERYTACVMHLQRVVEIGLKAFGDYLVIMTYIKSAQPSWQGVLSKTGSEIKSRPNASWSSNDERMFAEGIQSFLGAVQVAWRNPSMHADKKYTEEEAEDIFNAVKGFMRHITKHLDEAGNFTL
jgi:hypothetical protein